MDSIVNIDLRQKAIDWINSKDRNFDKGLDILKESGYKPFVAANFEANRNRADIPSKLIKELRLFVRYCSKPNEDAIHEDEPPLIDPDAEFEGKIAQELQVEYPGIVKQLVVEFSDLYKARGIYHKDLKNVGENNDEKSIEERKRLSLMIDASSRRMDILWKALDEYKTTEKLPSEELFAMPFNPELVGDKTDDLENEPKESVLPETLDELIKLKENTRIKLLKAENRLNFQQDKKADKPNPMPEGPKRIKLEKKIEEFKDLLSKAEIKIAELG